MLLNFNYIKNDLFFKPLMLQILRGNYQPLFLHTEVTSWNIV